jgi:hypothetical protein
MIAPRFCPACGTETTPPYRFCPGCGQALGAPPSPLADPEPLFYLKRPDLEITIYASRIELVQGWLSKRPAVIPIAQVTGVTSRAGGFLTISTADGRKHELRFNRDAETDRARDAIRSLL